MREKFWEALGFATMGLILFVATMVIIKWLIDFVTWTTLDSGWAQAIGSVAALGIAIYIMREQARFSLQAENRALIRQANTVSAIVEKLHTELQYYAKALKNEETAAKNLHDLKDTKAFFEVSKAVDAIPLYSLGSIYMVRGIFEMQKAANEFAILLEEAKRFAAENPDFSTWNGGHIAKQGRFIGMKSKISYGLFLKGVAEVRSDKV